MSAPGRAEQDRPCAIGPAAVTHGADIGPAPRRVGAGDAATTKGGHALHRVQPPTLGREPAPRSRALETRLADRGVRGIGRRDGQRKRRADDSDDDHDGHEHAGPRRKPRRRRNAAPNSAPATAGTKSQDAETKRPTNALGTIANRPSTKSAVASMSAPKAAAVNDARGLDGSTERPTEMPPATTTRSAQGK